ncbi:peptide-methionine (S)-S-oxide reductase MsrA [Clavibacter michiganensis]|uniref:peptide-methionine (S)-S-oxide reductase MsrA n=1 Tax=Clavibacter michiganensis TaxID=28447 RepID=UPI000B383D18|nr:peptide-methionine (S)-S-oxide reductase MsrA [Clavibacter michiganensis]MDO4030658.1 peptide-methionine (S)-S-oxide reductase MsrA [Clavibacter michiganensis]MDO4074883.1 peptide-methionine (S)-S-oxide reductase MsrA [Clavibacter michiganensis]MDO4079838.1 peptide-methionine (S)-S-oxide reductase MsrA [Clavibacter michiganensis]MDO4086190.1 peptide-methionine (S)-S-oxide reductase MsrA [Clavibacter michiganensis]MDO4095506.1 peptide-methionine (S)-S-oxide reductase MsrA [Clavibacter michig
MQTFILAGGCFWCLDAVYRTLDGVQDVISGYIGGHTAHPSYVAVCTGATGHAEAVKVVFDEEVIPADVILDVFFTLHDPRQLNRQGADVGTQYRSAMFPADAAQEQLFRDAISRAGELWDGTAVTTIEPVGTWYDAEDYHQDFFAKNPGQGYCNAVAVPKVNKVRKSFAQYVRAA